MCLCNDYTYLYLIIYCLWYYVVYWCMRMWMWMCSRSIERSIQYNYTMLSLNGIACREFYRFPLNKPLFEWEKNATQRSILQGHREMHSTADYWEKKILKWVMQHAASISTTIVLRTNQFVSCAHYSAHSIACSNETGNKCRTVIKEPNDKP